MFRFGAVITLLLSLPVFPPKASAQKPWGGAVDGLRCRLSLVDDTLLEGSLMTLAVETMWTSPGGSKRLELLNREFQLERYTVLIRNRATGETHERRLGQSFGPPQLPGSCDGTYAFASLVQPLEPDTFSIRLMKPDSEAISPGAYDVHVVYVNDGRTNVSPDPADEYPGLFWTGTISSPPVNLTILDHPRDEVSIYTNGAICLNGYFENLGGHWAWSWTTGDSAEIRYRPRPGHTVGRKTEVRVRRRNAEDQWISTGHGGSIMEHDANTWDWLKPWPYPEAETLLVTSTVFESGDYQRFGPRTDNPELYRVLWTATFEGIPGVTPECPKPSPKSWFPPKLPRAH